MTDLQLDITQAYAALAEADRRDKERIATIERSKLAAAKKALLAGTLVPRCRCIHCITAICQEQRPDKNKCLGMVRDSAPPDPCPDIE